MSRFLAPIHFWLFNKIKYYEELEKEIIKGFKAAYDEEEVDNIEKSNIEKYGNRIPDKPLEELIDTNNIHGWLQERIRIAETRQAAILADLFHKYKDSGILLAKNIYKQNGTKLGEDAKSKYNVSTPKDIYNALNNYILDGMPCDNVNSINAAEDNYLEYSQLNCLHKGYWNEAGAEPSIMYDLRSAWIRAFVNSANPDFEYQVTSEKLGQREEFRHKIFRK